MLNILEIRNASHIITLLLAYFFSVIFTGYFQALLAKKMGDDTAEEYGFLSLQPSVYIDWVGLLCLFLFRFGWGRVVPINYHNFCGRYRSLKFAFVYMFSIITHFSLAVIGMTALMGIFGADSIVEISNKYALFIVDHSSYAVALVKILSALVALNIALAMIRVIFNIVDLVFVFCFDRPAEFIEYRDPYALATILLACIFFSNLIYGVLDYATCTLSSFIAHSVLHIV